MRIAARRPHGVAKSSSMGLRPAWLLTVCACVVFLLFPPAIAYAVQYVGPPPSYFCCQNYGDVTVGYAPRVQNTVYRQLGSGIAALTYSGGYNWLYNTGYNPFNDYRTAAYAQAACSNQSSSSALISVTCFATNG